jgi:EAL domain-containing protein (putative c-di-GMP-specific phosphodiesterase class I)
LYFQPLLHIKSCTAYHYEALLRLTTDDGLVAPQVFLPAAVRFGLMADLDAWVIEHTVRALAELRADCPELRLSMNLSSFAFEDETLGARVRALLKQHSVSGDRIVLEITEQLAVRFAANTDKQITMLRDLGCKIAIDDFGTGYSSFSYLKRLPVDYLKIDGSFIKNIARDRVDQSMVRMIGEVARAAGMEIRDRLRPGPLHRPSGPDPRAGRRDCARRPVASRVAPRPAGRRCCAAGSVVERLERGGDAAAAPDEGGARRAVQRHHRCGP